MIRVWILDDEPLAVRRLSRLVAESGKAEIAGVSTDPEHALAALPEARIDALLLDIEMPGLNGFDVIARLAARPAIIFTTAYDHYALKAFEAEGLDYLLKPVTAEALDRALDRVMRRRAGAVPFDAMLQQLKTALASGRPQYPSRIASRVGDRVQFIDLDRITHFFADGKLTWAATPERKYVIDDSIAQLETRLDPAKFHRIHRACLVKIDRIAEITSGFGGRMVARLNDEPRTELPVARDRVRGLRERLGF